MKKNIRYKNTFLAMALAAVMIIGCSTETTEATEVVDTIVSENITETEAITVNTSAEAIAMTTFTDEEIMENYKDADLDDSWDESTSTVVDLSSQTSNGDGATFTDGDLMISESGTYVLSGDFSGTVQINVPEDEKVKLVLNGVNITATDDPAIYVGQADKTTIVLADGTENYIEDGTTYTLDANGAIYSENDLSITGSGSMTVVANNNNGISTKDDLKITDGTINVTAVNNGLKGKDSVRILDGEITINSGGDGIQSDKDDDETKGFVVINGGTFDITSANDGIQAETSLTITDGDFNIVTGGGSIDEFGGDAATTVPDGSGQRPTDNVNGQGTPAVDGEQPPKPEPIEDGQDIPAVDGEQPPKPEPIEDGQITPVVDGEQPPKPEPMAENTTIPTDVVVTEDTIDATIEEDTVSTKGLKAETEIIITGGTFSINSLDDAINSGGSIEINGDVLELSTDDDAVHAETSLTINDGTINILTSLEGLEGNNVYINGGDININANDDAVNANGDFDNITLEINGGTIFVNAHGDGLDSNDSTYINGGTIVVDGSSNHGDNGIDIAFTGEMIQTGGTVIATSIWSTTDEYMDETEQNILKFKFTEAQEAGTTVNISDSEGNSIIAYTPSKEYDLLIVSSPELTTGETYTISTGGTVTGDTTANAVMGGEYIGGTAVADVTLTDGFTAMNEDGTVLERTSDVGPNGQGDPNEDKTDIMQDTEIDSTTIAE